MNLLTYISLFLLLTLALAGKGKGGGKGSGGKNRGKPSPAAGQCEAWTIDHLIGKFINRLRSPNLLEPRKMFNRV